jgi:hypothetical protein
VLQIGDIHYDKRGFFILNGAPVFAAEFLLEGCFQGVVKILIKELP